MNLSLKHIYKVYQGGVKAVNDFCMEIADKEFIVIVGPSGCGKTTTLRMIAGLEDITAGELAIGGCVVNDVPPKDRDIAMVFQNYALYPHMTVYENMALGLEIAKKNRDSIDKKVREAAGILGITEYLDRLPKALSGGQRQRAALGRAIVGHPDVFLLDEPLSNLDAKLRAEMRGEIIKLHFKLGATFIYVTHDQVEAMTMGDRIVVMRDGSIQQIDTPQNVYDYPANEFVAGFMGSPQMNFFAAVVVKRGDKVVVAFAGAQAEVPYRALNRMPVEYMDGRPLVMGVRPEDLDVVSGGGHFQVRVDLVEELGGEAIIYAYTKTDSEDRGGGERVVIRTRPHIGLGRGDVIGVNLDAYKLHFFDRGGRAVKYRLPPYSCLDGILAGGNLILGGTILRLPPALADLPDGETRLEIPVDAVTFGKGGLDVDIVAFTDEAGVGLYELTAGGQTLFAAGDSGILPNGKAGIDFKRVVFTVRGERITPLPAYSALKGGFVSRRQKSASGRKERCFYYVIGGCPIPAAADEARKLLAAGGRAIYSSVLNYTIPLDGLFEAENGAEAVVRRTLDFGDAVFAELDIGGQTAYIRVSFAREAGRKLRVVPRPGVLRVTDEAGVVLL